MFAIVKPAIRQIPSWCCSRFPASSHQYRNLIPLLADRFHVIAPDYPGFGDSAMPDPAKYTYSFDKISELVESFLKQKGFDHFGL